ncbi:amidase family protein [Arthrobacter sp. JSM 101049]|uniref:amidase family protein n=1 Tax=Arthrobacter sp. JSM 101049 TaxID=929097 RepID=UPI0035663083
MNDIHPIEQPEPGVWTQVADAAEVSGQPRAGEPFALAVKANIAVRGFRRSAGCRGLDFGPQEADAPVVAALRDAGAVVVGITNMHELAFGITSNNAAFGPVRHPADPTRAAGGSSGGSAAAVARGDVPVAVGTDTGGSVTIPASLCGVVGFRPTTGRWPGAGLVGLSWTRDTPGLFARTVEEIQRLDDAIAPGIAGGNDASIDAGNDGGIPASGARLAIPAELVEELDRATATAFTAALDMWGNAVETVDLELGRVLDLTRTAEMPIVLWESHRLLADVAASALGLAPEEAFARLVESVASPDVRAVLEAELSHPVTAEEYARAQAEVARARTLYTELLAEEGVDGLVFPGTPAPAPLLGQDELVEHLGEQVPTFGLYTRNTGQGTMLGAPMLTLPAPVPEGGLPVGITLQGARFDDRTLLARGRRLEEALAR